MPLLPHANLDFAESASRTHYILKGLGESGLGQKVDYLYDSMRICISSVKITSP